MRWLKWVHRNLEIISESRGWGGTFYKSFFLIMDAIEKAIYTGHICLPYE